MTQVLVQSLEHHQIRDMDLEHSWNWSNSPSSPLNGFLSTDL